MIVLQWDIFIAKINKNSGTFFEAILRNVVTYWARRRYRCFYTKIYSIV